MVTRWILFLFGQKKKTKKKKNKQTKNKQKTYVVLFTTYISPRCFIWVLHLILYGKIEPYQNFSLKRVPIHVLQRRCSLLSRVISYTVDSRYIEFQGTRWNTSRYPYLEISELQKWIEQPHLKNEYVIWILKIELYRKYCEKEEHAPSKQFLLFFTIFFTCS